MGVFFTSHEAVLPTINTALKEALLVEPATVADIDKDTSHRTMKVYKSISPTFNAWRFWGAAAIAGVLLGVAIWTELHNLADISKDLMQAFTGFMGVVLGLLGGEAQKSST
jgi:hypothetical protein